MPKNEKKDPKRSKKAKRCRLLSLILSIASIGAIVSLLAIPVSALGTGAGSTSPVYHSAFEDVKLEVTSPHPYSGMSNVTYYTEFNPEIFFSAFSPANWQSYLSIAFGSNPQTAIYVNGSSVRFGHTPLYSVNYDFDITDNNNTWGRLPLLEGAGSMLSTYIFKLRHSDMSFSTLNRLTQMPGMDNSVTVDLSAIGPDETGLYLDDLDASFVIEATYYTDDNPLEAQTYRAEIFSDISEISSPDELNVVRGRYACTVDPIAYLVESDLYSADIHISEWTLGMRYLFTDHANTEVKDEADIEAMGVRFGGLTRNTYVDSETPFNNSYFFIDDTTVISNDFNPLDWVVNVAEAFLNITLFETVGGFPVTLIGILSTVVSILFVILILKLYFGG